MLDFSYPWMALLGLAPLLLRGKRRAASEAAITLPALAKLASEQQQQHYPGFSLRSMLALLIWLLLVLSATQPRWLGEPVTLPQQGRDLMLALDLSGSMEIADMQHQGQSINRLDAVKMVVSDFIKRRQGDRIGLILFADAAYQQTPLTFDLVTVQKMLDDSVLRLVGTRTAIGEAIGLAVKRLNTYDSSNKVLILKFLYENEVPKAPLHFGFGSPITPSDSAAVASNCECNAAISLTNCSIGRAV